MSKGERSCKVFGKCNNDDCDCNVDCDYYNPIKGVTPDTISAKVVEKEDIVELEGPDIVLLQSDLDKFTKNMEFVVLKRHVFYMQNISPKKIILKYKRKLKATDPLTDGIYCFKNSEGDPIEYKTAFKMIDTYVLKKREMEAARVAAEEINKASAEAEEE